MGFIGHHGIVTAPIVAPVLGNRTSCGRNSTTAAWFSIIALCRLQGLAPGKERVLWVDLLLLLNAVRALQSPMGDGMLSPPNSLVLKKQKGILNIWHLHRRMTRREAGGRVAVKLQGQVGLAPACGELPGLRIPGGLPQEGAGHRGEEAGSRTPYFGTLPTVCVPELVCAVCLKSLFVWGGGGGDKWKCSRNMMFVPCLLFPFALGEDCNA